MSTYTVCPTYSIPEIGREEAPLSETFVIDWSENMKREIQEILSDYYPMSDGADVYEGSHGSVYDINGEEVNYCGWVAA